MIKFGPGGNCEAFYEQGGKSSMDIPAWLKKVGLNAYEYECGRGVKISEESANRLGELARENGITLSVHAPYFTNISSTEDERIDKTISYIMQSAIAAKNMGAGRVVVHMGAAKDITRACAMEISKKTMKRALSELEAAGLGDITLCPETMGKINQMGTLEEVLELCATDERLVPTIDYGHLNARSLGGLSTKEDFEFITDKMFKKLGEYRAKNFHVHFSKIEFTKGGEKKHVTFDNTEYGPLFEPLAQVLFERGLTPTIICESAGTQTMDALYMKKCYDEVSKS